MVATGYTSTTGDARKLALAGGTMTGDLVLNDSTPDTDNSAASKAYVDAAASAGVTFGSVTAQTSFGLSSSNGVATTASRSDHVHGTPADPGGGSTITFDFARVTSGNLTAQNTGGSWALLTSSPEISIAAAIGDRVTVRHSGLIDTNGTFLDLAVVTGATPTIVRYASSGTATPATEGHPGVYATADASFARTGLTTTILVQSGDLSSGSLRFRWAVNYQGSAAILYASTDYPLYWDITNYGPA